MHEQLLRVEALQLTARAYQPDPINARHQVTPVTYRRNQLHQNGATSLSEILMASTPVQPHAFDHARIDNRIISIACIYCNAQFWTPRRYVLRVVERVHRCPKMLRATGQEGKPNGVSAHVRAVSALWT